MIVSYITRVKSDRKILNSEVEGTNMCENLLSYIHIYIYDVTPSSSYSDQLTANLNNVRSILLIKIKFICYCVRKIRFVYKLYS